MTKHPRNDLLTAITSCGHSINANEIVLRFDPRQEGPNALNQLNRRVSEFVDQEQAANRQLIRDLTETLEWVRANYAAGRTSEINHVLEAAISRSSALNII